jgi:O-antigen ligase
MWDHSPIQTGSTRNFPFPAGTSETAVQPAVPPCHTGLVLFLLLNAVLFIRPAEIVPGLVGWPIYEAVIVACLVASLPAVFGRLTLGSLSRHPGEICVIALLPAIILSHLLHGQIYEARLGGMAFLKVVLYYLLLVGLVNSIGRLRMFLLALVAFILPLAILSLLQYHGIIDIPALAECVQSQGDGFSDEIIDIVRLQALGIFSDPNDFSLILACGMLIGIHHLVEERKILVRLTWVLPISILGYAITLTRSRGGFLALIGGLAAYMVSRRGWRRSIFPGAIALPVLLVVFGGRQTAIDLNDSDDTAQGRILLWRDSMELFRGSPIIGIGYGQLADVNGLVAHNSFVHAYAELGLLGGSCFVGAFYCAIIGLRRLKEGGELQIDPNLLRWRPCVLAMTIGYAIGLFSLSRCYGVPTYLILGVATVYGNVAAENAPATAAPMDATMVKRIVQASFICLVVIFVFIKLFAH